MPPRLTRTNITLWTAWLLRVLGWLYVAWALSRLVGLSAYFSIGGGALAPEAWYIIAAFTVLPIALLLSVIALVRRKPWARIAAPLLSLLSLVESAALGPAIALVVFAYLALTWRQVPGVA